MSPSTPGLELGGSKDLLFWNITMYWNKKVYFKDEHCKKYWIYQKMLQTKVESCAELNFLRKTPWKHISIYSRTGGRGLQRFDVCIWNRTILLHNFIVSSLFVFQLLLSVVHNYKINCLKYFAWNMKHLYDATNQ